MIEYVKILELNKFELSLILNAITCLRAQLVYENIDTSPLDNIITKTTIAPIKTKMLHKVRS